jgi:hypothetical protein
LFAVPGFSPLVEAVGEDQTSAVLVGIAETILLVDGLCAGVDELVADLGVVCPVRDETLLQLAHRVGFVVRDDRKLLARGSVVAWFHAFREHGTEPLFDLAGIRDLEDGVAPAHDYEHVGDRGE